MPLNNFPTDWNYYEVLDVDSSATKKDLIIAYRLKARMYHPDNQKTGNEEVFKQINEAFRCLGNPKSRQEYDDFLRNGKQKRKSQSKKQSADTVRLDPNPSDVNPGKLAWDEQKQVVVDLVSFKDRSLGAYLLNVRWVGGRPVWATKVELPDDKDRQFVTAVFTIDATAISEGSYDAVFEIDLLTEADRDLIQQVQIPVSFKVGKIAGLKFKLRGQPKTVQLGPLEPGQTESFQATLENLGPPVWETPTFEWVGGTPIWASDIGISSMTGQIFPLNISFIANATGCKHTGSPYRGTIAMKLKGKTLGKIPVILQVKKIPEPDVYPAVDQINFGRLEWCENKTYDLKLVNHGDPPKSSIRVTLQDVAGSWLRVESIEPQDKDSFPKLVRLKADASRLEPGDYLAKLLVSDGSHTREVPVSVRVGPKPQLVANPAEIDFTWRKGETLSFKVEVRSVGGSVPYVGIAWSNTDYVAYDAPVVRGSDFPVEVHFSLRMDGYEQDSYYNRLVLNVSKDANSSLVHRLEIPVRGNRKKYW